MMTIREAASAVKRSVSAEQAAALYGVQADRHHYAVCPFHGERTGSLRFFADGGFKCFGCGAAGSALDFVMQMDGCAVWPAVRKLNEAFGLNLDLAPGSVRGLIRTNAREARLRAVREQLVSAWEEIRRGMEQHRDCLDMILRSVQGTDPSERTGRDFDRLRDLPGEIFQLNGDIIQAEQTIARLRRWPEVSPHG